MADFTKNYNLEKPLQTEYYDVDVFNSNADKIDKAIKSLADRTTGKLEYELTIKNGDDTQILFNNTNNETIEFYAPASGGDKGDFLVSQGYDKVPDWVSCDDVKEILKINGLNKTYDIVIAAYDSSDIIKSHADYVCDSNNAAAAINTALDTLKNGGRVYLASGNYNCTTPIKIIYSGITFEGSGYAAAITSTADDKCFEVHGNHTIMKNLRITYNGQNTTTGEYSCIFFNTSVNGSSSYCTFNELEIDTTTYAFSDHIFNSTSGGHYCRIINNNITTKETSAYNFKENNNKFLWGNIVNEVFTDNQ